MKTFALNHTQYVPSTKLTWREVHGELVAIDVNSGEYHVFNAIGKLIWLSIDEGCTAPEILTQIEMEYIVNKETALADLNEFLGDLCDRGLLINNSQ
ncbi:MAG: PqqD family protein [Gammaproteobacteria bacterium]|nr:PqqD family protein [Gammaproteobacteria bacterium]